MNSPQTLSMVFCIDDNFAPHLAALLTSIIVNTQPGNSFTFYVFSAELSEDNKTKLKRTVGESHHIAFNHMNATQFKAIVSARLRDSLASCLARQAIP